MEPAENNPIPTDENEQNGKEIHLSGSDIAAFVVSAIIVVAVVVVALWGAQELFPDFGRNWSDSTEDWLVGITVIGIISLSFGAWKLLATVLASWWSDESGDNKRTDVGGHDNSETTRSLSEVDANEHSNGE